MNIIKFCIFLLFTASLLFCQHLRTNQWYWRTATFKNEVETLAQGGIVFLGNSITDGFDFEQYFTKTKVINRGISADHIDGIIERIQYSAIDLQPAQLFILIGINDIGAQDADSTILGNYKELLGIISIKIPDTKVYIHSILPTTSKWKNCPPEKIVRLNLEIKKIALDYNFTWIDIYSLFVNDDSFLNSELTDDGLHLNSKGYQLWAKKLQIFGLE